MNKTTRADQLPVAPGALGWRSPTGLVLAANGLPLVGMDLLSGSRVCVEVITGGPVTIERLP